MKSQAFITNYIIKIKKSKIKITNITKDISFFFHIENFFFIYKKNNRNDLRPSREELNSITNLIDEYNSTIKEKFIGNNKIYEIIPEFFTALKKFEKSENKDTIYKIQVEKVIKDIFQLKYSLMTFSRILLNNLNLR